MALLPLVYAPHPVLRKKARPVEIIDEKILDLADSMLETMYAAAGIGLAANQVGETLRIFVIDLSGENKDEDAPPEPMLFINPEILWRSEELSVYEEGCLSIPDQKAEVTRPARIKLRYQDRQGKEQEMEAEGLAATCIQHEIDHLNGRLFVDYLGPLRRRQFLAKAKKLLKEREREAARNEKRSA